MKSPTLELCHRAAERAEHYALELGSDWDGRQPILNACATFRGGCDALAQNRGLLLATIAFVGPKNAGKTTLMSLLVTSDKVREQLKTGDAARFATDKPTWIGPELPQD